jgi:adenylate kinase family enzyme
MASPELLSKHSISRRSSAFPTPCFTSILRICTERCLERAKTSGRADDTEEIILKRIRTYNDHSKPVVELYKKRKLVLEVDGAKDAAAVWDMTKKGMPVPRIILEGNPKIVFVLGGPSQWQGHSVCKPRH